MVLASLALIGIIGLQAYWLRQSITVKEDQFRAQVSASLNDFTRLLEKRRDADFIYDNYEVMTDPTQALSDFGSERLYEHPDSMSLRTFREDLQSHPGMPDTYGEANDGYEVVSSFSQSGQNFTSRGRVEIRKSVTDEGIRISRKIYQLDSMFLRIMKEEYSGQQPIEKFISKEQVDSLLKKFLSHHGVNLDFAFGIYDGEWLEALESDGFQPTKAQYSAQLFPNHLRPRQSSIHIHFPGRRSFLLRSIWGTLALGAIFTAIIVIAFGSSLRVAMRQKRLSEMKTDFINNMTHEFKTPIATISLALDAMKNPKVKGDPEKVTKYRDLIKQENIRMNQQVEDVLRLAMLDRRELEMQYESIDMHDLIEKVADRLTLKVESRNGSMSLDLSAKQHLVRVDIKQMEAVIQNLLDNALKYSPKDPKIKVTTTNAGRDLIVSVIDNGMGMKPETQRYIFDRFYRSETGNVHNIKGHGLGLAFVKGVLLMHNSRIQVKSALGQGSTFTFNLSTYDSE